MQHILETERLRLREFTLADTSFILELLNSPGWLEFIGDRQVQTEEQAKAYLENGPFKSYQDNGFGLSMVELKEGNQPIGMCGILKRNTLEDPDIGFAFLPVFSGKGYAFEIAEATLNHAQTTLHIPTILAITVPENKRSIHLLEKIGMTYQKDLSFPGDEEVLMLFSN
jgi:RimJ/RimL family protein N-acetyltransferase